jgi:hypothetical protein
MVGNKRLIRESQRKSKVPDKILEAEDGFIEYGDRLNGFRRKGMMMGSNAYAI